MRAWEFGFVVTGLVVVASLYGILYFEVMNRPDISTAFIYPAAFGVITLILLAKYGAARANHTLDRKIWIPGILLATLIVLDVLVGIYLNSRGLTAAATPFIIQAVVFTGIIIYLIRKSREVMDNESHQLCK